MSSKQYKTIEECLDHLTCYKHYMSSCYIPSLVTLGKQGPGIYAFYKDLIIDFDEWSRRQILLLQSLASPNRTRSSTMMELGQLGMGNVVIEIHDHMPPIDKNKFFESE